MVIDDDNVLLELDDDRDDYTELKFKCPFCRKNADYLGGCSHFVFSFEMVNFEYIEINKDFEKQVIKQLNSNQYKIDRLPCPLAPWAEDDEGNEMPSLHKLVPGLEITGYSYSGPHGHGSWGIIVGFQQKTALEKGIRSKP